MSKHFTLKNKKNIISLSSAELAHRVVKVKWGLFILSLDEHMFNFVIYPRLHSSVQISCTDTFPSAWIEYSFLNNFFDTLIRILFELTSATPMKRACYLIFRSLEITVYNFSNILAKT